MAGRGSTTFQKRQKEQQRKDKQAEKLAKRLAAKHESQGDLSVEEQIARERTTAELAEIEMRQAGAGGRI